MCFWFCTFWRLNIIEKSILLFYTTGDTLWWVIFLSVSSFKLKINVAEHIFTDVLYCLLVSYCYISLWFSVVYDDTENLYIFFLCMYHIIELMDIIS